MYFTMKNYLKNNRYHTTKHHSHIASGVESTHCDHEPPSAFEF